MSKTSEIDYGRVHTKTNNHQYESFVGKNKCVLVSDLSGSTSTTRKYGFIHWASIVARMQQIVMPIFYEQCRSIFVGKEADDLIAIFDNPENALAAACCMKLATFYYNNEIQSKNKDRSHFMIKLGGIGLHIGNDVTINKTVGHVYGTAFEHAFQLGENIADGGDIILSDEFVNSLANSNCKDLHSIIMKNTISSDEIAKEEPSLQEENEEIVKYRKINITNNNTSEILTTIIKACNNGWSPNNNGIAGFDDKKYLKNEGLSLLAKRHDFKNSNDDIQNIDNHLKKNYTSINTAIMFNTRVSTENFDDRLQMVKLFGQVYDKFDKNEIFEIGATYLLFKSSLAALKCVVELKNVISKCNTSKNPKFQIISSGFGLHRGDILAFADVFMQFGDALNTASKIGEDLGKNGAIIITEEVKQDLGNVNNTENIKLEFQAGESNISGVALKYYTVSVTPTQMESYDEYNPKVIDNPDNFVDDEMKHENASKRSVMSAIKGRFANPYNKLRREIRRHKKTHSNDDSDNVNNNNNVNNTNNVNVNTSNTNNVNNTNAEKQHHYQDNNQDLHEDRHENNNNNNNDNDSDDDHDHHGHGHGHGHSHSHEDQGQYEKQQHKKQQYHHHGRRPNSTRDQSSLHKKESSSSSSSSSNDQK